MVNSGGDVNDPNEPEVMTPAVINGYDDDLCEGYNDFDPQLLVYGDAIPSPQVGQREFTVQSVAH